VTAPGPSGPPAPPGPWFRAAVAWPASPGPSGSLDVALLAIEDPRWTVPKLTAVPWGRVVDDWPVAVVGLGFPDAAAVGGSPAGGLHDRSPPGPRRPVAARHPGFGAGRGARIPGRGGGPRPHDRSGPGQGDVSGSPAALAAGRLADRSAVGLVEHRTAHVRRP